MNFLKKVLELIKKNVILFLVIAGILLLVIIFFIVRTLEAPTIFEYSSEPERIIANEVKGHLDEYLAENELNIIANEAVKNYNAIVESGVERITDEHISALNMKLYNTLDKYIVDEEMGEEEKKALASSINKIILDTILKQLENTTGDEIYREEYKILVESLQQQIDTLKKMSFGVTELKDNNNEIIEVKNDIYENIGKEFFSIKKEIENIKQEIESIPEEDDKNGEDGKNGKDGVNGKNGMNGKDGENGKDGVNGKDGENGKDGVNGKDGENGKDGVNGKDGKDGENGKDGKNGENGKDGKDGVNGKDGKDGIDGKTTYIAYADDQNGTNFSFVPTESSKFIGTCITSAEQPTEAIAYTWQQYRSYIIRSVTDENQNTTIYIN